MNQDFHDVLAALIGSGARFVVVAWSGRVIQEQGGIEIPFLGRAELIRNKKAGGRAKDSADLDALRQER